MIEQRRFKVDWFKVFVTSHDWDLVSIFSKILGTSPFLESKDEILGQKFWHEIWRGDDGSTFCAFRPPSQAQIQIHKYCIELTGKFLTNLPLIKLQELCRFCFQQDEFQVKRIDLTCDFFPCQGLNLRPWENYLNSRQLLDYRSIKRILNNDRNNFSSTVYLGSRRSEAMVRLYSKDIDGQLWDRWELELKAYKADQAVEQFMNNGLSPLLDILFGSIVLIDEPWFDEYKLSDGIKLCSNQQPTNLERSIKFLWSISASLAMLYSFLGESEFNSLVARVVASGKLKLRKRHLAAIREAVLSGVKVGILLIAFSFSTITTASASEYFTCPVGDNQSIFGQLPQKFPMDIVLPNSSEKSQFNQASDGCFQINTGGGNREICTPGMLVSAIKPFIIIGVGIKFIFSG